MFEVLYSIALLEDDIIWHVLICILMIKIKHWTQILEVSMVVGPHRYSSIKILVLYEWFPPKTSTNIRICALKPFNIIKFSIIAHMLPLIAHVLPLTAYYSCLSFLPCVSYIFLNDGDSMVVKKIWSKLKKILPRICCDPPPFWDFWCNNRFCIYNFILYSTHTKRNDDL